MMRQSSDEEFARAGWVWVLRKEGGGLALACSVDGSDADKWRVEGRGDVVNVRRTLSELKEQSDG